MPPPTAAPSAHPTVAPPDAPSDARGAGLPPAARPPRGTHAAAWAWWALIALALWAYLDALGHPYAPTNGDELVYTHIARRTAQSGHWLPLQSDLPETRNTKPPLLFWQALWAGGWGERWSLLWLRAPSVAYSAALALWLAALARAASGRWRSGALAAATYLAFFSTFRYGRSYLTSAPETFWLNLPVLLLLSLWLRQRTTALATDPDAPPAPQALNLDAGPRVLGWGTHAALGVCLGVGLLYKSFALLAPAAAAWWAVQLALQPRPSWALAWRTALRIGAAGVLALGVFALWFALDPNPAAVWAEFIVAENAGKLNHAAGYWHTALAGGGFSVWAQALGYVQLTGLLMPLALGAMGVAGWRLARLGWPGRAGWARLSAIDRALLVWLGVWLAVFMLPSQRSARYLIDAMPALALLWALHAPRLPRWGLGLSVVVLALAQVGLGRIAQTLWALGLAQPSQWAWALGCVGLGLALCAAALGALRQPRSATGLATRPKTRDDAPANALAARRLGLTLAATLAVYASFNATIAPLDGPHGRYPAALAAALHGQRLAVPSSFNGQFERFEFLLPGARWQPYDGDALAHQSAADVARRQDALLAQADALVWLQTDAEPSAPLCAAAQRCRVLAARWEVKGRHKAGEINWANLWQPQQWLLRREWLLARVTPATAAQAEPIGPSVQVVEARPAPASIQTATATAPAHTASQR